MDIIISPAQKISGIYTAPPSKSYAHRLIMLSCLMAKESTVFNIGDSIDIKTTLLAMQELGANFKIENGNLKMFSFVKKKSATIDCKESGTTLRFMLAICSALGIKAKLVGAKTLLSRPNDELIKTLNEHGANIKDYEVNGKITSGEYEIDGSISSQYISALMIALSLFNQNSKIIVKGKMVSEDYINITIDCLALFNVEVIKEKNIFIIKPKQKKSPKEIYVEGDYSSASNILAMGAINGKLEVLGLRENSLQGDRRILEILSNFGAKIRWDKDILYIASNNLDGIEIDGENIPDLIQLISIIAIFARGKTVINNVSRLQYKESDRLTSIIEILKQCKIKVEYKDNALIIYGGNPASSIFDSRNDHRTAMALAVLCAFLKNDSKLYGPNCVEKSYPNFFNDYEKIGGKINGYIK